MSYDTHLMASNLSKADALTPIITFVSVIVVGIVISEFIIQRDNLTLPIILFSFFVGIVLAVLEMRAIIGRRRMESKVERRSRLTDEEKKDKLARYVADLFDEDIPFDEIDEEKKRKMAEMMSDDTEDIDEIELENDK